jgi:hypothetical protein
MPVFFTFQSSLQNVPLSVTPGFTVRGLGAGGSGLWVRTYGFGTPPLPERKTDARTNFVCRTGFGQEEHTKCWCCLVRAPQATCSSFHWPGDGEGERERKAGRRREEKEDKRSRICTAASASLHSPLLSAFFLPSPTDHVATSPTKILHFALAMCRTTKRAQQYKSRIQFDAETYKTYAHVSEDAVIAYTCDLICLDTSTCAYANASTWTRKDNSAHAHLSS